MTSARVIEYRITRDLLEAAGPRAGRSLRRRPVVERIIGVVAGAATLLLAGSLFPELVVAAVAASLVVTLK